MRLTTRTNLAMRALMFCAANEGRLVRKSEIASVCNVSENHLAQVIHALGLKGFLATHRGRAGGITLSRPMGEISVGSVFRALEAEVPFLECFAGGENDCPLRAACRLKCVIKDALAEFYEKLDRTTIADLIADNDPLRALLRVS